MSALQSSTALAAAIRKPLRSVKNTVQSPKTSSPLKRVRVLVVVIVFVFVVVFVVVFVAVFVVVFVAVLVGAGGLVFSVCVSALKS